ncbi:MAG TPA: endonuclease [Spirochaetes bacterium]|nr:endonuclease [Spirochaetota bacterium]
MSADNQQERSETAGWLLGFVDGEGTFSISIFRNNTMSFGWQVFPEFVVTQGKSGLKALEKIKNFFECGNIYKNSRRDNHCEDMYKYCVRNLDQLVEIIVPFFQKRELVVKKKDFNLFSNAIDLIVAGGHKTETGLVKLAKISEHMNRKRPSKFLESSQTIRQTPLLYGEDIVGTAWRHAELGRNDPATPHRIRVE